MSEKQKEFLEGIKDLNKYSFDIIDKTLIEDTNIEAVLPCNKCDGDCCGIVPFKREHIIHIFNKYTDSKKSGQIWGLSRPCEGCIRAITTFNIKKVVYSIEKEGYEIL